MTNSMTKELAHAYMAERAVWLHESSNCDWDDGAWISRVSVLQNMLDDLLFCLDRPDPKLSAAIVADRWQKWLDERQREVKP